MTLREKIAECGRLAMDEPDNIDDLAMLIAEIIIELEREIDETRAQ